MEKKLRLMLIVVNMDDLIIIKLGGSLITDKTKPFTARPEVIRRLAREIHEAKVEKNLKIIVGHGGGSFPHKPAKDYRTNEGIVNADSYKGIALVQDAASRLNRIVVDLFIEEGENAISVQPSAGVITENGKITEWYLKPVKEMLKNNLLPVPYGDVAMDSRKGCCIISTEEVFSYITKDMHPKKIILAGMVDGVFTADPQKDPNAKLIPEINSNNYAEIQKYLGGSAGIDVTGGMISKVQKIFELAKLGVEIKILSGEKEGVLKKTLLGDDSFGTTVKV